MVFFDLFQISANNIVTLWIAESFVWRMVVVVVCSTRWDTAGPGPPPAHNGDI